MKRAVCALFAIAFLTCASAPPAPRHIIYLHGRIVQEQESARPVHPEHGPYELEAIAEAFRKRGFVVTADRRAKGTTVSDGADFVVKQVRALLDAGVPPERITVVGASMGSSIALRTAVRLQNPRLRFALISPCLSVNVRAVEEEERSYPAGRMLVVRDESDVPSATCPAWTNDPARTTFTARELVINTGRAHGFLYQPLPEWLEPVVAFANE